MGYRQYKDVSLSTTPPEQGVRLLLEGAIRFAEAAGLAIDRRDVPEAHNLLLKAQDIVIFLRVTLNPEGKELSLRMAALLDFVTDRLVTANIQKDRAPLEEALRILRAILADLNKLWEKRSVSREKADEQSKGLEIRL